MSFVSPVFVLFFPVVCWLYFSLPYRWRWVVLLIASYTFYAYWNAKYVLLLASMTLIDYSVARLMATAAPRRRKLLLSASLTANLGVLFIFKYFNFFSDSFAQVLDSLGVAYNIRTLNVLLPLGISFHTFQSMAYTFDVYRRKIEPEQHLGIFATFVAFFPQLVAGPIERAGNILPQLHSPHDFDYERIVNGLRRILWGVFKKVVIADQLAIYVNVVYNNAHDYTGPVLILATIFFTFQIYCDFSGYSDIARGCAQVLGIHLMENFRQPYLARSVREFWRRWHISLSTWFRDYLYIPLGGNRVAFGYMLVNIMIVFVVSGLWHGASWTFAIWGALHGSYLVGETVLSRWGQQAKFHSPFAVPQIVKILFTFMLVSFAWIFFRANSLNDAWYIVTHLFSLPADLSFDSLTSPFNSNHLLALADFMTVWGLLLLLLLLDWLDSRWGLLNLFSRRHIVLRWSIYYVLVLATLYAYGAATQEFIYFQF